MIRRLSTSDLDELITVTRPYFKESFWGRHTKYSESKTRDKFYSYLKDLEVFAIDIDGIVAWAAIAFDHVFSEELTADYEFFFVSKEARGTGASRILQAACEDFARMRGASVICACGSSDVGDGLWVSLFKKFKYQKIGTVMAKVL